MRKTCGSCRHWYEFSGSPHSFLGTCRVRASLRGGCLAELDLADPLDRLAACMWPTTADTHLCGKFAWKCRSAAGDCRENTWPRSGHDQDHGLIFCEQHMHEKRRLARV